MNRKNLTINPEKLIKPILGFFCLFLAACGDTKEVIYFDNIPGQVIKSNYPHNIESTIQLNDLLSITVSSANPLASAIFNAPNESTPTTSQATSYANTLTVGYLVDLNGNIAFPVLGKIHAAGLTKNQLASFLVKQLVDNKQLIDPIITIRQLNFRISVLGEVAKPGVYSTPNEKISFIEALSFAGDITIYGKRDNVMLIREDDKGDKLIVRVDLTTASLFSSPYYYLKSNDVIYVEPSTNKVKKEKFAQITPIVLGVLSLAIITVTAIVYHP